MAFLDDNYLIGNATGKRIFNEVKDLPVIDPHNHANVREIADNACYTDAWQLFAATDHYVWEMLRKRGVPESLIPGSKAPAEHKFRPIRSTNGSIPTSSATSASTSGSPKRPAKRSGMRSMRSSPPTPSGRRRC